MQLFITKKESTVFVIILIFIGFYWLTRPREEPIVPQSPVVEEVAATHPPIPKPRQIQGGENGIIVEDQDTFTNEIIITEAQFKKPGYVVIYTSKDGVPENVIGHSDLFQSGNYRGFLLEVPNIADGSQKLIAAIHADDGDGIFGFPISDPPVIVFGAVMIQEFSLSKFPSSNDE